MYPDALTRRPNAMPEPDALTRFPKRRRNSLPDFIEINNAIDHALDDHGQQRAILSLCLTLPLTHILILTRANLYISTQCLDSRFSVLIT